MISYLPPDGTSISGTQAVRRREQDIYALQDLVPYEYRTSTTYSTSTSSNIPRGTVLYSTEYQYSYSYGTVYRIAGVAYSQSDVPVLSRNMEFPFSSVFTPRIVRAYCRYITLCIGSYFPRPGSGKSAIWLVLVRDYCTVVVLFLHIYVSYSYSDIRIRFRRAAHLQYSNARGTRCVKD